MLSEELLDLAAYYSKEAKLPELPEQKARQLLEELVDFYLNDKNSSALRERIVLKVAGYLGHEGKLGYNGETSRGRPVEVKPVNVRSNGNKKLNGGGNFQGSRPQGIFLRSASFNYKHYLDCKRLRLRFYARERAGKHAGLFTKGFKDFLDALEGSRD